MLTMNCKVVTDEETEEMFVRVEGKETDHEVNIKHFEKEVPVTNDFGESVHELKIREGEVQTEDSTCDRPNDAQLRRQQGLFPNETDKHVITTGSALDYNDTERYNEGIGESSNMGFVTDQDIMKYYDGIYLTLTKQFVEKEYNKSKNRPYICDVCGKTFTETYTLNLHMKLHTGENLHRCEVCGKLFTLASNLKSHLRLHAGVKPYKCSICGNEYNQAVDLARHERSHTGERPYVCQICGKSFVRAEHCKTHQTVHTGIRAHKCDVCGRTFSHIGHLRTHIRIHSGDKPFKCDICGKEFTHSSDRNKHAVVHSTEKPFKCQYCDKSFARKDCKNRHEKIHLKTQSQK